MSAAQNTQVSKTAMQKFLDAVERIGNSVPHPVVIFLILIAIVLILSHIVYLLGASVSYQMINPDTDKVEMATTTANSLLTADGIRHIYTQFVPNFLSSQELTNDRGRKCFTA
jgi:aminobenzoyl-glutamate transport protein